MTKQKAKEEIVILGAGLAGLSTAYHLKKGYSLYEKESEAGGTARSIHKDGYIFDFDGHLLHFRKEYTFLLVRELLEGNLAPHKRSSWIYSKGSYTRYPFQANFYGLPRDVVKECLLGYIEAKDISGGKGKEKLNGNFENWIKNIFGSGIAKYFMIPYNKKFWTVDPSQLGCDWLDGFVPVPTLEDTVTGAISSNTKSFGYNSRFWYPVKGGISELTEGFLRRVNNVHLDKRAVTIDQYRREIVFEDGVIKRFKKLITTIPLPELYKVLVNLPPQIKEAFRSLRWTSIYVANLGIKIEDETDRHWVYYPEDNIVFYRTGFPTNFSMDVAPPKRTSIYAEVSYSDDKKIDRGEIVGNVVGDLEKLGIINNESDIEVSVPIDIKYGYVIYDKNRSIAIETIKDYLKRFGIHTIGRYGSWKYMSMEDVIIEGKDTADTLSK